MSYDDTGLASSTTYYYRVRAHNIVGDGSYVSTNATTDTPVVAPGAVTSYTASALSSSSIRLTWSAPSTGTSPFTYRGERATNSSFTAGTATLFSSSSSTTYTNTGLSSGTTYYFRVRAINSAGSGPYTTRSAVTTGSAPTVPTGLTATALDDDRVRLSWTASSGPTPITYDIQQNNTTIVNNRTSTTYTRSGLSPNTSYNFRVRAGNSNGHSAWTSNVSATTHTIALGASIAFTGSSVATTALGGGFFTYTWTGTFRADGSAGTTPYTYDWSGSTGGVISGSSTSRNVTIVVTSDVAVTPPANDAIVARVAIGDAASGSASAAFTQTVSFA